MSGRSIRSARVIRWTIPLGIAAILAITGLSVAAPGGDVDLAGYCTGANGTNVAFGNPKLWISSDIKLNCALDPGYDTVTSVDVVARFMHPCPQVIRVELRYGGRTHVLHNQTGSCSETSWTVTAGGINTFNGLPVNGTWQLYAIDQEGFGDKYYLDSWQIKVDHKDKPTSTPTPTKDLVTATPTPTVKPTIPAGIDVTKFVRSPAGSAGIGDTIVFEVQLHNSGQEDLTYVRLEDINQSPSCMTFKNASLPGYAVSGSSVIWNSFAHTLQAGDVISFNVAFDAVTSCAPATNKMAVSGSSATGQSVSDSDTASITIGEPRQASVAIDKRVIQPLSGTAPVSSTVAYRIAVTNTGTIDIHQITLQDVYPRDCFEYVGATVTPTLVLPGFFPGMMRVLWYNLLPTGTVLSPGQSLSLVLRLHAKGPNCTVPRNCAYVTAQANVELFEYDCVDIEIEAPQRRPAIEISKARRGPPVVQMGDRVTFTLAVTNTGPVPLDRLLITDTFDLNCMVLDLTSMPPWANTPQIGGQHAFDALAPMTSLPPGGAWTLDMAFIAVGPCAPSLNCAEAVGFSAGIRSDPDYSCDVVDIVEPPEPVYEVDIAKRVLGPATMGVGGSVHFEITVKNTGDQFLANVFITDTYDVACLEFLNSTETPYDSTDDGELVWYGVPSGGLAPGDAYSFSVHFRVRAPCGLTENCAEARAYRQVVPPWLDPWLSDPAWDCAQVELIGPGIEVFKRPLVETVCVSETIPFEIEIVNTGQTPLTSISVTDYYSTACLDYRGANLPPSVFCVVLGLPGTRCKYWPDIVPHYGHLMPGDRITMTVEFHAEGPCHAGNLVKVDAQDAFGAVVTGEAMSAPPVVIEEPISCGGDLLYNGGFELGNLNGWTPSVWNLGPAPRIEVASPAHVGNHMALLGGLPGDPMGASNASISQAVAIPANAAGSVLSFWYHAGTTNPSAGDKFGVFLEGWPIVDVTGNTGWQFVEVVNPFGVGNIVHLDFSLGQTGQANTWAFIDDVRICIQTCNPENPPDQPPPRYPGLCPPFELLRFDDYAPEGMPDFDQKQADWDMEGRSVYDAAVAAADIVWWEDSKHEVSTSPPPETIADTYPLVQAYQQHLDDHSAPNVPPLVHDLAAHLNVGPTGVDPADVERGLAEFIADQGLGPDYRIMRRPYPTADHLRDAAVHQAPAMVLIGFWEHQRDGLKLLGGHWAAVAAVGCEDDRILLADPMLNNAEAGGPGYVRPWGHHFHPNESPDIVHNDARWVSHDEYLMVHMGGERWHLQGYPVEPGVLEPFMAMNRPPGVAPQSDCYLGGPVYAVLQDVVVLVPTPPLPVMRLTPVEANKRAGQVFEIDLVVDSGPGPVSAYVAHLNFDPELLQVVGPGGGPADRIIPAGPGAIVLANAVDNEAGTIDFAVRREAPFEGRFRIARIPFRALAHSMGHTQVSFSFEPRRTCRVVLAGEDLDFASLSAALLIEPGATLLGSVEMEDRPAPPDLAYVGPLTVRFFRPGADVPWMTLPTATGEGGGFVLELLAPGDYDIAVKGLNTLGRRVDAVSLPPGDTAVHWEVLPEGDVAQDNLVNIYDASLLSSVYGAADDQWGPCAPWADLNQDGIVDDGDLGLLARHFWEVGDITGTMPTSLGATTKIALSSAGEVVLALSPQEVMEWDGEPFVVSVDVLGAGQPVDGIEVSIAYDPDLIEIVDPTGSPAGGIIPGGELPDVMGNVIDREAGMIRYAAANVGGPVAHAPFTAARILVLPRPGASGETWMAFRSPAIATWEGENVLMHLEPTRILLGSERVILPLILRNS